MTTSIAHMHIQYAARDKSSKYSSRSNSSLGLAYTCTTDSVWAIWRSSRVIRCWAYQNIRIGRACRVQSCVRSLQQVSQLCFTALRSMNVARSAGLQHQALCQHGLCICCRFFRKQIMCSRHHLGYVRLVILLSCPPCPGALCPGGQVC